MPLVKLLGLWIQRIDFSGLKGSKLLNENNENEEIKDFSMTYLPDSRKNIDLSLMNFSEENVDLSLMNFCKENAAFPLIHLNNSTESIDLSIINLFDKKVVAV